VSTDGRSGGFLVVGAVDADFGEDVQGVLPVFAGLFVLAESVVGVGEPVVGAGLVEGLAQLGRQGERPIVVGNGCIVRSAALSFDRGVRINAVSPGLGLRTGVIRSVTQSL
jgi:hypothetical protein